MQYLERLFIALHVSLVFVAVNFNAYNLTVPVTISLRSQKDGIHRRPVFWDFDAQGN